MSGMSGISEISRIFGKYRMSRTRISACNMGLILVSVEGMLPLATYGALWSPLEHSWGPQDEWKNYDKGEVGIQELLFGGKKYCVGGEGGGFCWHIKRCLECLECLECLAGLNCSECLKCLECLECLKFMKCKCMGCMKCMDFLNVWNVWNVYNV